MTNMTDCRINDHITLKLKNGKTVIYVDGKQFRHCKALILNFPREEINKLEGIESIDELIIMNEINEVPEENIRTYLTPEEEFWGHCSTLQAFVENNYNTNLIGGNLAFSLLANLYYSGDPIVKKIFKQEIVKRLSSGFFPVVLNLVKAGYSTVLNQYEREISFMEMRGKLSREELKMVIEAEIDYSDGGGHLGNFEKLMMKYSLSLKELDAIKEIEYHIGRFIPYNEDYSIKGPFMYIENGKVKILALDHSKISYVPQCIGSLIHIQTLKLNDNDLKELPDSIGKMESLETLNLHDNQLSSLPDSIRNLKNLKILILSNNKFNEFPLCLHFLSNIKHLSINNNKISSIENNITMLKNMESLDLSYNNIKIMPSFITKLKSLKELKVKGNPLKQLQRKKNLES